MVIFIVFAGSVVLSTGAVALMLKLSHKKAWYDHVNERKIHTGEIPRLGGIGFASVFIIVAAAVSIIFGSFEAIVYFWPCLVAMMITLVSGAFDDFKPIKARYKLLLQFVAALCIIIPGFIFRHLHYFDNGILANLGWLSYPITILWIVGLTNAINLIDGVDGLAGGLSAIIAFFIGLIFFFSVETSKAVLLCASLFGVLIGFLFFNAPFPRAKIFMGDCGSQFLGLSLALLPLVGENYGPKALPLLYAAALFSIPIFDTTAAVWRRLRDRKHIYDPDKSHIHHKLINLGLNAKGVSLTLYSLQIVIGVLTFIAINLDGITSLLVLGSAYLTSLAFFAAIHFLNRSIVIKGESKMNLTPN